MKLEREHKNDHEINSVTHFSYGNIYLRKLIHQDEMDLEIIYRFKSNLLLMETF